MHLGVDIRLRFLQPSHLQGEHTEPMGRPALRRRIGIGPGEPARHLSEVAGALEVPPACGHQRQAGIEAPGQGRVGQVPQHSDPLLEHHFGVVQAAGATQCLAGQAEQAEAPGRLEGAGQRHPSAGGRTLVVPHCHGALGDLPQQLGGAGRRPRQPVVQPVGPLEETARLSG